MYRKFDYLYVVLTIVFTVYGQLITKWRVAQWGDLPISAGAKIKFLFLLVFDPYILTGYVSAFLASLAWMAALTKFDLSYAYPFMSLNFVVVLLLSVMILQEPLNLNKVVGIILITLGTIIASR